MRTLLVLLILSLFLVAGCVQSPPTNDVNIEEDIVDDTISADDIDSIPDVPDDSNETGPIDGGMQAVDGVTSEDVVYFQSTTGFLAKPEGEGTYPGVVLIHEWWGLNDNIKNSAQKLAKEGYVVLAVDLYNGQVASTSSEAQALVGSVDLNAAIDNMQAAVAYLRTEQNAPKVGSWGWCFGGGKSLQLAVSGEDLDATVLYYGQPITDQSQINKIDWPVLGIFGEEDQSISVAKVLEFQHALEITKKTHEIFIYPNVGHAFANPSNANYAPDATADAWAKTIAFLNANLKDDQ